MAIEPWMARNPDTVKREGWPDGYSIIRGGQHRNEQLLDASEGMGSDVPVDTVRTFQGYSEDFYPNPALHNELDDAVREGALEGALLHEDDN